MNNKGQVGVGAILIMAISVIVGVILFTAVAQQVGSSTSTVTINKSTGTVVNETAVYLLEYRSISSVVVYNETGGAVIAAADYVLTNNVIDPTTGGLSVRIVPEFASNNSKYIWYVTGTAQKTDYIADNAGRAIAGLIAVFFALAIAVVAITPSLKSGLLDLVGR